LRELTVKEYNKPIFWDYYR